MTDETEQIEDVVQAVGPRLRAVRQEKGATLSQVSATTGISASTLSRLESGQRRPTLELLLLLARAYQVAVDDLVGAAPTGDPRVHLPAYEEHGMTVIPLTRRPGGMRAYKQLIPVNWPDQVPEQRSHEGYEWMYVISGRVRLLLGNHDVVLGEGEVAEFDTRVPHFFANPGPGIAELLSLYGPQGERLHVRARSRPSTDR